MMACGNRSPAQAPDFIDSVVLVAWNGRQRYQPSTRQRPLQDLCVYEKQLA